MHGKKDKHYQIIQDYHNLFKEYTNTQINSNPKKQNTVNKKYTNIYTHNWKKKNENKALAKPELDQKLCSTPTKSFRTKTHIRICICTTGSKSLKFKANQHQKLHQIANSRNKTLDPYQKLQQKEKQFLRNKLNPHHNLHQNCPEVN